MGSVRAYENCEIIAHADDEYVTATREVGQGHGQGQPGHGRLPVYQLHYAVYYNVTDDGGGSAAWWLLTSTVVPDDETASNVVVPDDDARASNVCARHYAETFLVRLLTLESWLNERCRSSTTFSPRVVVHTVVVVRNYRSHVSVINHYTRGLLIQPELQKPVLVAVSGSPQYLDRSINQSIRDF